MKRNFYTAIFFIVIMMFQNLIDANDSNVFGDPHTLKKQSISKENLFANIIKNHKLSSFLFGLFIVSLLVIRNYRNEILLLKKKNTGNSKECQTEPSLLETELKMELENMANRLKEKIKAYEVEKEENLSGMNKKLKEQKEYNNLMSTELNNLRKNLDREKIASKEIIEKFNKELEKKMMN